MLDKGKSPILACDDLRCWLEMACLDFLTRATIFFAIIGTDHLINVTTPFFIRFGASFGMNCESQSVLSNATNISYLIYIYSPNKPPGQQYHQLRGI